MTISNEDVTFVLSQISTAYLAARKKHAPMRGAHEGYAILKEEVDELWAEIKADNIENARLEAYQVAAMALAFLLEVRSK